MGTFTVPNIYVLFTSKLTMATNPTGLEGIQSIFSDDKMLLLKYNNADISAVLGDVQTLFRDNKSYRMRPVFKCMC